MNDSDFEKDLPHLLRPAAPSAELHARIQRELRAAAPASRAQAIVLSGGPGLITRLLRDFGWACAGAAAALTALAFVPVSRAPVAPTSAARAASTPPRTTSGPVAQNTAFEHDGTSNELLAAEDSDELVETTDGPAREVRYSYRERHEWSNPQTGARVVLEVPREDVYLLPVSLR